MDLGEDESEEGRRAEREVKEVLVMNYVFDPVIGLELWGTMLALSSKGEGVNNRRGQLGSRGVYIWTGYTDPTMS